MEKGRIVLPKEEAKGKREPRAVYLATDRSRKIIQKAAQQRPIGPLLVNRAGNPWTSNAIRCRFKRLEKKIGRRIRCYDFRHGWITRKLLAGVDSHVVAALAGHRDTRMIDRVYSHVAQDHEYMLSQARR